MNKDLIDLQKGVNATCAVIKKSDLNKLDNIALIDSKIDDSILFGCKMGNPIFKDKLENVSKNGDIGYFIIDNFDLLPNDEQNKFVSLIKDREFMGYKIPNNIIIVLTIENKDTLKNISKEIYHFCVVSI